MSEQNKEYWAEKLSIWLHDPVMKALNIQGHEEIAKAIAERLFQSVAKKDEYASADVIAAGLTRASLPAHNPDETKNGAIDFLASPVITHPLVKGNIQFKIPDKIDNNIIAKEIEALLVKDLGLDKSYEELRETDAHKRPLNGWYDRNATPEEWNKALYFYLFFAFQKRIRNENIGGLGSLWDMLPADTRMPDHSIWSHLGLTSAIGSTMKANSIKHNIQLAEFSITPVQDFISKSRKLRDYWTSSVILSYLAFTGIKTVMNKLGPDHVVYPSLHNQSLVESWIKKEFHLKDFLEEDDIFRDLQKKSKSIAAFPNKFVFIVSPNQTKTICEKIKNTIQNEWIKIAGFVKDYLARYADDVKTFEKLFGTQIKDYWNYSYSSCDFVSVNDIETVKNLLPEAKWKTEYETVNAFKFNSIYDTSKLYGVTHSLVQGLLAAGKTKPTRIKQPQHGEKCPLCGEHEVLHSFENQGNTSAKEYNNAIKSFWNKIRKSENPDEKTFSQVGEHERLCAVCAVKRFLPKAIEEKNEYKTLASELREALDSHDKFPSTTEMSAHEFLQSCDNAKRDEIIQKLHEHEFDTDDEELNRILKGAEKYETKYYAFLLMDGDKMGDLINGETLSATWGDVIHPKLKEKFNDKSFAPDSKLRSRLNDKRTLNPAVHETISDSLNNFARFAVQPIIEKHKGKLIYAGGDDVCAILPLSEALDAALEISKAYNFSFARYTKDGAKEIVPDEIISPTEKKIGMHLGSGSEGISISGAIVIAHHKEPLKEVISEAHQVLDGIAKEKSGRNSLAIRLKKRSGENRDVYFKWNDGVKTFKELVLFANKKELSASLLYRIKNLRGSIEPLADNIASKSNKDLITKLIHYEVAHSEQKGKPEKMAKMAEILFMLCVKRNKTNEKDKEWFMSEAPIIANFLANGSIASDDESEVKND